MLLPLRHGAAHEGGYEAVAVIQFPNVLLNPGSFTATVEDNNGNPSTVLDAGTQFRIRCSWQVSPLAALLLGGRWEIAAYVESVGQGPEQQIGPRRDVQLDGRTTPYQTDITVPANTLPNNPAAPQSGVYKLVTVLTHRNFGSVSDVSAVEEGPFLRIG
jgi:hypothetical protein